MNESLARSRRAQLGFWLYLMSDVMLFAALFATFVVLQNGRPIDGSEHFDLSYVLIETIILLVSSVMIGIAYAAAKYASRRLAVGLLVGVATLGLAFVAMELYEFGQLVSHGYDWQRSASLSAFFTLIGTHGIHILIGCLWAIVLITRFIRRGIDEHGLRKLLLLSVFWHFLDLIWIFIFTVVYLMGGAS